MIANFMSIEAVFSTGSFFYGVYVLIVRVLILDVYSSWTAW